MGERPVPVHLTQFKLASFTTGCGCIAPRLSMAMLAACGAIPEGRQQQPVRRSTQIFTPRPEARACLATLGKSDAGFTPLPDQYYGAGCSTLNTVKLVSLRSDSTQLGVTNLGPVTCPLAGTFAAWARFGADRAARQILGSPLVRIETMGSYACRNVAGTNRLSGHASANAVDVAGFVLAGQQIGDRVKWWLVFLSGLTVGIVGFAPAEPIVVADELPTGVRLMLRNRSRTSGDATALSTSASMRPYAHGASSNRAAQGTGEPRISRPPRRKSRAPGLSHP